jgi:hypothetical protein
MPLQDRQTEEIAQGGSASSETLSPRKRTLGLIQFRFPGILAFGIPQFVRHPIALRYEVMSAVSSTQATGDQGIKQGRFDIDHLNNPFRLKDSGES